MEIEVSIPSHSFTTIFLCFINGDKTQKLVENVNYIVNLLEILLNISEALKRQKTEA